MKRVLSVFTVLAVAVLSLRVVTTDSADAQPISVGFFGYPGEGSRTYDDDWIRVTEPGPMPEAGRAFERRHGYLPTLHVANVWGRLDSQVMLFDNEIVLDVLRGKLPKFPVGAPVTDEMYALPPAKRTSVGNDW